MAERRDESRIPVFGIVLLFLGIVFLLQALNVLPWRLWGTLWRYWPVILVIIGLSVLLRSLNRWLVALIAFVLLFGSLGLAILQSGVSQQHPTGAATYSAPLADLQSASVSVDFAAGTLKLSSLPAGSPDLVRVASNAPDVTVKADLRTQGTQGILSLEPARPNRPGPMPGGVAANWDAKLAPGIPLNLNVKVSAGSANIDLSSLKISGLSLDINAGSAEITMPRASGLVRPRPSGTVQATIKSNVASTEITIPDDVAARIRIKSSLSTVTVNESRFPKNGDYYVSPNFATAGDRLEIEVDCNVGRFEVK